MLLVDVPRGWHRETNEDNSVLQHPGYDVLTCPKCGGAYIACKGIRAKDCGKH